MTARARFWIIMLTHTGLAAGTYIMGKAATAHFPVLALGLFRFVLAALCFLLLMGLRGTRLGPLLREDWRGFLLSGFLGVVLNQLGFLWGLKLTLPSHGALLYALTPTVVLLHSWLKGAEKPTRRKLAGIALAFSGVVWLFSGRQDGTLPSTWLAGDFLILLAVVAWAAFTVQSRPLLLKHGPEAATSLTILLGTALFLPVGAFGLGDFHPAHIPFSAWLGAAYLGLVSSVVMYLLWFRALSLREASRVSIVANGQPILTALLAWAVFGTPPTAAFGVGAALVIAGVVIAQT